MNAPDSLILGQGLAGSLLAYHLLQAGQRILILDDHWQSASSRAAAGLINPVTGRRLVRTRTLEQLLPAAEAFYHGLEQRFSTRLLHPRPMLRLIRKEQDIEALNRRRQDPDYCTLLGPWLDTDVLPARIRAPLGGFEQYRASYLDLPLLLQILRDFFQQQGCLRQQCIDLEDLKLTPDGVELAGMRARRIIFCEGHRGRNNPWFCALPFQPAKGEILTLRSAEDLAIPILSAGHWLIPMENQLYRLGSNYDHLHLDENTTEQARQALLRQLPRLLRRPPQIEVVEHRAGVRPALHGAQPVMGPHPCHPQLHIFNGLGSKGSLLAPFYAQRYAETVSGQGAIPEEVNITRFHDLLIPKR